MGRMFIPGMLVAVVYVLLASAGRSKAYPAPTFERATWTALKQCGTEESLFIPKAKVRPLSDADKALLSLPATHEDPARPTLEITTVVHFSRPDEVEASTSTGHVQSSAVCPGVCAKAGRQGERNGSGLNSQALVVVTAETTTTAAAAAGVDVKPNGILLVALTEPGFALLNHHGNLSVVYSCDHTHYHCLSITMKGHTNPNGDMIGPDRHRRAGHMTSQVGSREPESGGYRKAVLGVVLAVVGVVCLGAVLALCGTSQTYETVRTSNEVKLSANEVPQPALTTAWPSDATATHNVANVEVKAELQQTNGALTRSQKVLEDSMKSTSSSRGGAGLKGNETIDSPTSKSPEFEPLNDSEEAAERAKRARSLSAKSQEPLPDLPPEDLSEPVAKKDSDQNDKDYDEDESPYDYALVPGEERMKESDSEEEEGGGGENGDQHNPAVREANRLGSTSSASPLPPYGKVTKHSAKPQVQHDDDEYSEVRTFDKKPVFQGRERSVTEPIVPSQAAAMASGGIHDKRFFTESATHLPLPAIPHRGRPPLVVPDESTYDSIPDDMKERDTAAEQVKRKPKLQETLYESVDEMKENGNEIDDMYESVPDSLKPGESSGNPLLSPLGPVSPTKTPKSPGNVAFFPLPPASPIPSKAQHKERDSEKEKEKEKDAKPEKEKDKGKKDRDKKKRVEKKELGKTLSAAETTDPDGKRRFSFLNRKKTQSVSTVGVGKQKKGRPVIDSPSPKNTSPTALSPFSHPPNIPAPSPPLLEDDDTYDRPLLSEDFQGRSHSESDDSPVKKPMSIEEAKKKSQSLPSAMRMGTSGISRPNIPLPDVPEDSGSGSVTVVHQKKEVVEDGVSYDVVVHGNPPQDDEEPNYDSVQLPLLQNLVLAPPPQEDPGYDKVTNVLSPQQNGGAALVPLPQAEGRVDDIASGAEAQPMPTGMQYGKVVRPASEVEPGTEPQHDESGYAVVPDEIKMRKRALSASKGVKQQVSFETPVSEFEDPGYDTVARPEDQEDVVKSKLSTERRSSSPLQATSRAAKAPQEQQQQQKPQVEEQYAEIDMVAKRLSQRRRKEKKSDSLSPTRSSNSPRVRSPSPIPPPIPPAVDLGVSGEFDQPPIPVQSEGVHQLMAQDDEPGPGYSRLNQLRAPVNGSNDPRYAKVRGDHPYATLENPNGDDEGYTTVPVGDKSSSNGLPKLDTTAMTNGARESQPAKSTIEQETPKLEPAVQASVGQGGPMYEGNIYDSLEPQTESAKPQQQQRAAVDADYEDIDFQEGYEEIDENMRRDIRRKFNN